MNTVRKILESNPAQLDAVKQGLGRAYQTIRAFQNDRDNTRKRDTMLAAIASATDTLRVCEPLIPGYKRRYFEIVDRHAALGMDARDVIMAFDRMVHELHTRLEQNITGGADYQAWSPLMLKILAQRGADFNARDGGRHKNAVTSGHGVTSGRVMGPAAKILDARDLRRATQGCVMLARMTTPDFVAALDKIAGIATERGGQFCHAAVLAREFNVPCVVGCGSFMDAVENGEPLLLDADNGVLLRNPSA